MRFIYQCHCLLDKKKRKEMIKYIDARLYEQDRRRSRFSCQQKSDPDYVAYSEMFDHFLSLAAYFRNKRFIPVSRLVRGIIEWTVPAFCKGTMADEEEAEQTLFYRDKWLELENVMNALANSAYVHARSEFSHSVISYDRETGETFYHDLTVKPLRFQSVPNNLYNANTDKIETRPMFRDGQGIVATGIEVVRDPRTSRDYKNLLLSMIFENK